MLQIPSLQKLQSVQYRGTGISGIPSLFKKKVEFGEYVTPEDEGAEGSFFNYLNFFFDNFNRTSLNSTMWVENLTGSGTITLTGETILLETIGDYNDGARLWGNIYDKGANGIMIFEAKVKRNITGGDGTGSCELGFYEERLGAATTNSEAQFIKSTADGAGDWKPYASQGGGEAIGSTYSTTNNKWVILKIEVDNAITDIRFYINGNLVETLNYSLSDNMVPNFHIYSLNGTKPTLEIDWVKFKYRQ